MVILTELIRPFKKHGLVFDTAVLLTNLLFFNLIPTNPDEWSECVLVWLLTLAVLAQLIGAMLKRPYLQQRLIEKGQVEKEGCATSFMYGLLLFHFILFAVSIIMALALSGIYDLRPEANNSDVWIVVALVMAGVTTGVVYGAGKRPLPPKTSTKIPEVPNGYGEYLADAALWLSVTILTQAFWQTLLAEIEPATGSGLTLMSLVLFIAMSLLFIFFYLPARYLYFVEDYHSPLTWVQAWLAMLPVAWRIFIG